MVTRGQDIDFSNLKWVDSRHLRDGMRKIEGLKGVPMASALACAPLAVHPSSFIPFWARLPLPTPSANLFPFGISSPCLGFTMNCKVRAARRRLEPTVF